MKSFIKIVCGIVFFSGFIYFQNNHLDKTFYSFQNEKVKNFIRIVHISDTHNKKFGNDNKYFLREIKKLSPDIIIHTGDLASKNDDCRNSFLMMEQLTAIASVYFIQGNHDVYDIDYSFLKNKLEEIGVHVIDNNFIDIGNNIRLVGLLNDISLSKEFLEENPVDKDFYNICLIHKPINFEKLNNFDFDLFLSGHTHGCQWRIPFIGGVISPDKKFFPGKDYGYKIINNTKGIINRGIGNPFIITRLNNCPEITILDISSLDK